MFILAYHKKISLTPSEDVLEMHELPPLDVCVLVKNEAKSIGKCLNSLLANNYPRFRILVCDGRSSDGTLEVISEYATKHENVLLHVQKSSGCGAARQELMQFVKTDYVAWTDGGSIVDKNWLREIITPLLNSSDEIVASSGFNYVISNNSALAQSLGLLSIGMRFKEAAPGIATSLAGNNACIKTEVLRQNPWATNLNYGDDLEMSLRLGRKGYKFLLASNAKAYVKTQETFKTFHDWIKRKAKGEVTLYTQCEDIIPIDMKTFGNRIKQALLKRFIALALSIVLLALMVLTPYKIPSAILFFGFVALYMAYVFKRRFNVKQLGEKVFKRTYLLFPVIDFLFIFLYASYIWKYSKSIGT